MFTTGPYRKKSSKCPCHWVFAAVRPCSGCSNLQCTYTRRKQHPRFWTISTKALSWHGRGSGSCRRSCPLDFENCSKKRLFCFSLQGEQQNFTILVHSRKIFEKYPSGLPGHAHAWYIWHEILLLVACLQISDCSEIRCFKKKVVTIEVMQSCKKSPAWQKPLFVVTCYLNRRRSTSFFELGEMSALKFHRRETPTSTSMDLVARSWRYLIAASLSTSWLLPGCYIEHTQSCIDWSVIPYCQNLLVWQQGLFVNGCHFKRTSKYHISEHDAKFTSNLIRHVTGPCLRWVLESCASWYFLSTPASPTPRTRRSLRNPAFSRPTPSDFSPTSARIRNTLKRQSPRTVSVQNLHQTCGKPLKTPAICFIDSGNSFSGSFQSQRNLETHYKVKEWNLVKLQQFTVRALFKKACRSLKVWPFQICSSAIHDMIIDTK